jgi:hypothetical protein
MDEKGHSLDERYQDEVLTTTSGNYPVTESLILDIVEEIADAKSDDLQESEIGRPSGKRSSCVDEAPAADAAAVDFSWSWSRGFANGWGGTGSDPQRAISAWFQLENAWF